MEDIIDFTRELMVEGDDVSLWKRGSDYQTMFSTYETWELIRVVQQKCGWE